MHVEVVRAFIKEDLKLLRGENGLEIKPVEKDARNG